MNKTRLFMLLVVGVLSLGIVGVSIAADSAYPTPRLNVDTLATIAGRVTNTEGGVDSISGSFVVFDPSVGGDSCYEAGLSQTFCFRAESFTDDYEYIYRFWEKFPSNWTVNNVYIQGTPTCAAGTWGPFSWLYETLPYEVVISHPRYQGTTDHCIAYYCFDVQTASGGAAAMESWYWDGDGYASPPHNPCSSDNYTPPSMSGEPCDEAINPQASIPMCLAPPDIYLYPTSLNSIQPIDTVTTSTIDICNSGEDILHWDIEEIYSGVMHNKKPLVVDPLFDPASKTAPATIFGAAMTMDKGIPEAVILEEGFEDGNIPPTGWTHIQTNPRQTWKISTFPPYQGLQSADVEYDDQLALQNEVLLTPVIDISAGTLDFWSKGSVYWCRDDHDNCDLNIWIVIDEWDGGAINDIYVGKADDDWPGTWIWTHSSFDLASLLPGGPVRLAFQYFGLDGAQIMLDAITLSEFVDIPWMSQSPITGTISGGECQGIDVTFDSSGLVDGDYYAGLQINSDDPDEPMVTVPVTLTVAAGPEIVVAPGSMTTFQPPNTAFARTLSINNRGADELAWVIAEQGGGLMEFGPPVPNQLQPSAEVAPVSRSPLTPLALGDWLLDINVEASTGNFKLLGVEFFHSNFWVTGGDIGGNIGYLYKFNITGNLLNTYSQAEGCTGWGARDLAFDGNFLYYGCDDGLIHQVNPSNGAPTGVTIPSPVTPPRALAYDRATDHFWTANWDSNIYEINRSGTIIHSFAPVGRSAYGMAWDTWSIGGPYLWLWSHDGPDPLLMASQVDPTTGALTGVGFLGNGVPGELAGGATISDRILADLVVFVGFNQGTQDRIGLYDLNIACPPYDIPWLSVSPNQGTTPANYSSTVEVVFNSTGLANGTYTGDLCIESNDLHDPVVHVPMTLVVDTYYFFLPLMRR